MQQSSPLQASIILRPRYAVGQRVELADSGTRDRIAKVWGWAL
jgi:hypothetical protein